MSKEQQKRAAAEAALEYVEEDAVVGVGTGSTVNHFIEALAGIRHLIDGAVASSEATEARLRQHNIPVVELNSVDEVPVYIDGADEATSHRQLTKGGGGALTREKIVAAASRKFVCIIDDSKLVDTLGGFPIPVEVIPMAQSYVGRQIARLGGQPELRAGFTTDNGNIIIDIHNMKVLDAVRIEHTLNNIAGIVCNGIFADRAADVLLVADTGGIKTI
ncbi:MAG: ribose-5-phosphate isomerase RpiA [Gammaproteobacteria bacterium]|nr:ribose-5-phosphate isomerase RpiA [Gammaproteobacteria bacterium]